MKSRTQDPTWPLPKIGPWPEWVIDTLRIWDQLRYGKNVSNGEDDEEGQRWDREFRKWKAKSARLQYERQSENWLPRDEVHRGLSQIAKLLRDGGEILGREFGVEATRVMDDILTNARRSIEIMFAERVHGDDNSANDPDDAEAPAGDGRAALDAEGVKTEEAANHPRMGRRRSTPSKRSTSRKDVQN